MIYNRPVKFSHFCFVTFLLRSANLTGTEFLAEAVIIK